MPHQPRLIRDEPTPYQTARDAQREEYLERLRERLEDLEFGRGPGRGGDDALGAQVPAKHPPVVEPRWTGAAFPAGAGRCRS